MAAAFCALVLASALAGQTVPTPPPMPKPRPPGQVKSSKAPLDFSGTWRLDEKASQNVSKKMVGAVLRVKQNGNRIWLEPVEQKSANLLAEQIVVDDRVYEKVMGKGKAKLQASWGAEGQSLWLQVIAGTEGDERAVQRSVWRLGDSGNTWTRQTWTINGDSTRVSLYVFRKRPPAAVGTKSPAPRAGRPTPTRKP